MTHAILLLVLAAVLIFWVGVYVGVSIGTTHLPGEVNPDEDDWWKRGDPPSFGL